jgi:amidophosphoribosyltransferase
VGEAQRNRACPQYCDACFSGDYPTRLTDLGDREAAVLGKVKIKAKVTG